MTSTLIITALSMTLILPIVGAGLAATPWIVRGTECFAVTIPASAARDPRLMALKRRYTLMVLAFTGALTAASLACTAAGMWETAGFVVTTAGMLALCVVPFLLMLVFRRRVLAIKEAEGWHAERQVRVAALGERDLPRPLSLIWECLHLPIAGFSAALALALLPDMPERVPIHFDAAGVANGWVDKGPAVVLLPAGLILFMGACMAFSHAAIAASKRGGSPDAPAASVYSYALYARAQSIVLVALGLVLNVAFSLLPLNMAGIVPIDVFTLLVMASVLVAVAGYAWIYVVYGQDGCRAASRLLKGGGSEGMLVDDDRYWKLGVFYANRDDPAIFVPKRFGVGWSLNWARPVAWGIMLGFAALSVAFVVGMRMLAG